MHQVGAKARCAPRDARPPERFLREHPSPCGTHPPPSTPRCTGSCDLGIHVETKGGMHGAPILALLEPYSHAEGNSGLISGYKSPAPEPGRGWDKQILSWVWLSIQCCDEKVKQMLLGWGPAPQALYLVNIPFRFLSTLMLGLCLCRESRVFS